MSSGDKEITDSAKVVGESMKKSEIAEQEEVILRFWQDNKIFEKSLNKEAPKGEFIFYDGPPFATGLPHYGHLLAGTIKDVIPRYKTMQGYHVPRRWGWDCHGLPIENLVEKELDFKTKKDIEDYGIEEFNMKARESVLRFADDWKKIVPRLGRSVDMENDYRTMDAFYSESIWWVFKTLYDRNLIYQGHKAMHLCPRCETTLSNFEVSQGYKDITDISVIVKFKLVDELNTYLLAWTTTPWTLPGNVALAVNPEIEYVEVKRKGEEEIYIIAKNRLSDTFKEEVDILRELKGAVLIGRRYEPLFDYYANDPKLENRENGWKIYGADFVTTEEGTGVVHIAPAFGDDDMELGKLEKLPFVQHVATNGQFKKEVKDFAGLQVKPAEDHQATDIEIIKYLAHNNKLFAKEKFIHSYPHCWRCSTPLLNYASSSWFVRVSEFRDKLVQANQAVNWIPSHVRDGRFGKWLEGARDWAISRTRFWGAPLPVWKCSECGRIEVVGSVDSLASFLPRSGNNYYAIRHGQAEANKDDRMSVDPDEPNHLTEQGKGEVMKSAETLYDKKIDLIFSSDFVRTKETAALVASRIGLAEDKIIYDKRLREINPGTFVGETWKTYNDAFGSVKGRLHGRLSGGAENYNDIRLRVMDLFFELDKKYQGKNILVVSHGLPLFMLQATIDRLSDNEIASLPKRGEYFNTGEVRQINFAPYPHNRRFELDLHRPYIDEFKLPCSCGGELERIPDVFDCWFESGAMPYGQSHYPFSLNDFDPEKNKNFPADFIAEGLDQTRGWFYSLIVLGVALFGESPYRNVVTNGLVLAEDGQKMSKSLKNYPDINDLVDNYGADALRLYLMSSPAVHGEDLNFSEKQVAEISRKINLRLLNVLSFWKMYADTSSIWTKDPCLADVNSPLDKWILARLEETITEAAAAFDRYEIDRSVTSVDNFIDDLSTWYLRRSRERFKVEGEDRRQISLVTRFALREFSKVLAPLAPFLAEFVYQSTKLENDVVSVHLVSWPMVEKAPSDSVIKLMSEVRRLVSLGQEFRQQLQIKVRQPLAEIRIKSDVLAGEEDYLSLIKDELNVKKLVIDPKIEDEVWLDRELSKELLAEGVIRELVRQIQERRKKLGLTPKDQISLVIDTDLSGREIIRSLEDDFKQSVGARTIDYRPAPEAELFGAGEIAFRIEVSQL